MKSYEILRKMCEDEKDCPCDLCDCFDISCTRHYCYEAWSIIADKIEGEINDARNEASWTSVVCEAINRKWPVPLASESLTDWIDRCWLPRPVTEDGSILQTGTRVCCLPNPVESYMVTDKGNWVIYDYRDNLIVVNAGMYVPTENEDTQADIDAEATLPPAEYCAQHGIDLGDDPDREKATSAMIADLLRRQRDLDAKGGE